MSLLPQQISQTLLSLMERIAISLSFGLFFRFWFITMKLSFALSYKTERKIWFLFSKYFKHSWEIFTWIRLWSIIKGDSVEVPTALVIPQTLNQRFFRTLPQNSFDNFLSCCSFLLRGLWLSSKIHSIILENEETF